MEGVIVGGEVDFAVGGFDVEVCAIDYDAHCGVGRVKRGRGEGYG